MSSLSPPPTPLYAIQHELAQKGEGGRREEGGGEADKQAGRQTNADRDQS